MKKSYILTAVLACVGVVATSVAAAKCHEQAALAINDAELEYGRELTKKEKIKESWPNYIPAAACCLATCGCVIATVGLSKRAGASMAAVTVAGNEVFNRYRKAVEDRYGAEAERDIYKQSLLENPDLVYDTDYIASLKSSLINAQEEDASVCLFFDSVSGGYFTANTELVNAAIYRFIDHFDTHGYATKADWYYYLGLPSNVFDEAEGWEKQDVLDDLCITKVRSAIDGDFECLDLYPSREPEILSSMATRTVQRL